MNLSVSKNQYLVSVIVVDSVAALCFPFTDWIGYRSVGLLLLFTVSVLTMRLNLYPVLLSAILSALIWDFFFIPPRFTFSVSSKEDALLLIMYFIVAILSGVFNFKIRQFENIARQKEEREIAIKLYNTLFDSISHELRTPIATILGATDALQENDEKLSMHDKKELTSEISNAALRLNKQLENLLNMSRLESSIIRPNFEWCDVNELIYNTLNKLHSHLNNHETAVEIDDNMPLVKLDFGLTEQVLSNIISNAANYTPKQTLISIKAFLIKDHEGDMNETEGAYALEVDKITYRLIIEISDMGKGFPIDEIGSVFDKFYRLKNTQTGGTGLGLFIAKGFVEAQNGSIRVSNKLEHGAIFTIEIPTTILLQTTHIEYGTSK